MATTNQQRRKRIKELTDLIDPLRYQKIISSLRHNYLINLARRDTAENLQTDIEQLEERIAELDNQINSLVTELRNIQVKYLVEYEGEVLSGGMEERVHNQKVLYLSTDAEIDSYENSPDFSNEDVQAVINEIRDYIYYQEYTQFTIQHIKRL